MLSGLSNMTELISHGFETRYDAPADRRSVRIRALVAAKDEETEESAPRSFITRLRAGIHDAINRWLHRLRRRTSDTQDGSEQISLFLDTNPSIDLEEMDDESVVLAELPGLDAKDFEIETDGRRLILRGQKKRKAKSAVAATIMPSAFTRTVLLPCKVDASKASATYSNGLLRIVLPKTPEAKERRLRVKVD